MTAIPSFPTALSTLIRLSWRFTLCWMLLIGSRLVKKSSSNCCSSVWAQSTDAHDDGATTSTPPLPKNDPIVDILLKACTEGDIEGLQDLVDTDGPSVLTRRSAMGETCLHVAGIHGQATLTKYVLEQGGEDPNVRSNFEHGLRMHPLSWNVYGGHVATARVLLQHGAEVNLDVDDMTDPTRKVTVLDIVEYILEDDNNEASDERPPEVQEHFRKYRSMKNLLLEFGAKRYADL